MLINGLSLILMKSKKSTKNRNVFKEGRQIVKFGQHCKVIKLDNHRYYRYVSGRGFKGVDFLVMDANLIFLIELKDYRNGTHPSQNDIAAIFYEKCEDTLRLIEIIHKVLMRRWLIRFAIRYQLTYLISSESSFWLKASELALEGRVVLLGNFEFEGIDTKPDPSD